MSFDQVFSDYVKALNNFYKEGTQESYNQLSIKRKVVQERDAIMLAALKQIADSDDINGYLAADANIALKKIGE